MNNIEEYEVNEHDTLRYNRRYNSRQNAYTNSVTCSRTSKTNVKNDNQFFKKRRRSTSPEVEQDQYEVCDKKQKIWEERVDSNSYREVKPISFTGLNNLVTKHPNEILQSISNKDCGFMILLRQDYIKEDMMALLLISLGKACTANLNQNVSFLLNAICGDRHFLEVSIHKYLMSFQLNRARYLHLEVLPHMTTFLQKFQETLSSSSFETISMLLPLLRHICKKFLNTHKMYDDVMKKLKAIDEVNGHFLSGSSEVKKASMQLTPDNFRFIPILPNDNDMHSDASLRPNLVQGKYYNTEQYLDIQFRLLREDFVKSFRDGINNYLMLKKAGNSINHIQDVRVYEDVHIVKQDFINGDMVHTAQFSRERFSRVRWKNSDRFLSGSLLCLSSDNFRTVLFASVALRLTEQLRKGLLLVRFEDVSDEMLNQISQRNFVVIESSAYFEAYRYNLKALQELNEEILPFKRYIVYVENSVEIPQYLGRYTSYDMRPLLIPIKDKYIKRINLFGDISIEYKYPAEVSCAYKSVQILNDACWPSASSLQLDDSQFQALKAAITKEFAIIQGPPGTGKTYIGLRIVQLLLHNIDKWFFGETNYLPILIVCYTNHALDQFLEGLKRFTNKIVRIGGGGKNEAVSKFQLNNLKRNAAENREIPKYIYTRIKHKFREIKNLKDCIERNNCSIQRATNVILGEKDLIGGIPLVHYYSLKAVLSNPDFPELSDDGLLCHNWLDVRSKVGSNDPKTFEVKQVKPQNENNFLFPECTLTHDKGNVEPDIDLTKTQRDINLEEFAETSFKIKGREENFPDDYGCKNQQKMESVKNSLHNSQPLEEKEAMKIKNVWSLDMPERWKLYKFWVKRLITKKQQEFRTNQTLLKKHHNELCEIRTEEDIFVLKKALVAGMTTTGAAKYRDIVLRLNPQILIVEEAAEILENHIVTSLAPKTQHVILIGDHQQLRPCPTVHALAVKYNFNISLFERMIKNRIDFHQLSTQHRMRPEIADLIVPHIYSDLKNHEVVTKYENIKGVSKNVFFVTHNHHERSENNSKSKINDHEANFLIELCKYFVKQGYDPSRITVLTTYTGQLFTMRNSCSGVIRNKVRFSVVDSFQGEENDIILISFVRSNQEGKIGFLEIANRVCVALSRAKRGLFCIGNFELFAEKSDLWKSIINTLKQKQAIGPSLELVCQNHPSVRTLVASEKDFDKVREGGCTNVCGYRHVCGHVCYLMCHPYDRTHENVHCLKMCNKIRR